MDTIRNYQYLPSSGYLLQKDVQESLVKEVTQKIFV